MKTICSSGKVGSDFSYFMIRQNDNTINVTLESQTYIKEQISHTAPSPEAARDWVLAQVRRIQGPIIDNEY